MRFRSGIGAAVLCILVGLGGGQGIDSVAASGNQTTVAVNIAESISVVTWPEQLLNLSAGAVPGEEVKSPELSFEVKANGTWGVEISCDAADGCMQEFDEAQEQYVASGHVLSEPLEWANSAHGPWRALSATPQSLVANQQPTGDQGSAVGFYLRFVPTYSDLPVGQGRHYRIVMHYTAGLQY